MAAGFDKDNMRLAAFDLDGTIYENAELLPETRAAIGRLHDSGIETVISTGRHPFFLPAAVRDVPYFRYAVASNGGIIADIRSREIFSVSEMPADTARSIATLLGGLTENVHYASRESGAITRADVEKVLRYYDTAEQRRIVRAELDNLYATVPTLRALIDGIDGPVVKFGARFESAAEAQANADMLRKTLDAEIVITDTDTVEITPRGVSKAVGLEKLCAHLGFAPEQAVVFGDSGNDAAIMRRAGYCVAMGNATDDIKEIADYITDTVENAGVAKAIRHLFGV
ncbi:MAG: HAD family hydrolase [Oscillospiraceae bacterium]|nr:HAD family hydrolase [Oscillospiraceae bacterium]